MHLKPPIPRMNSPNPQMKNDTPTGRTNYVRPFFIPKSKGGIF